MCPIIQFQFLLIALVFGIIFVGIFRRMRAFQNLNLPVGVFGGSKSQQDPVTGLTYEYQYVPQSKNSPARFYLRIPSTFCAKYEINKEKVTDVFFKQLGISCELQTGEPEFDKDFYIVTDDIQYCSDYFRDSGKREAIRQIFEFGFTKIKSTGKKIEAEWTRFDPSVMTDSNFVSQILPFLAALVQNLPPSSSGFPTTHTTLNMIRFLLFAFSICVLIGSLILLSLAQMYFITLDQGLLFVDSLKYGVSALAIFLLIAVFALKGRSASHRELGALFFISLFSFPLAGFAGELFANGRLDSAPAMEQHVQVIEKWTSRSKSSTYYHAQVSSWRGRGSEKLKISSAFYQQLIPQQTRLIIKTKPGACGFEWIQSYQIEAK